MRVTKEAMERHHQLILAIASAMLRERGVQGVSVADIMQAAGLTHGGFYRHFASKDALVADATHAAFAEIFAKLEKAATRKGATAALEAYVSGYLSQKHVETPSKGCPIPSFGGDIAREGAEAHAAFHAGVTRLLQWIATGLPIPEPERAGTAIELLSLMVGAVVTARAAGDPALSRKILAQARDGAWKLGRFSVD
jgi:TetR/AcrR family transcriptional regulator, transcriptional repressor for nem operon